ncbi:hypothetical protein STRDD04_01521 [Streptococcus sp. DD04]|nr:hypothetical protein STRDD04_01521 [Streptococcus sp. DD04]
MSLQNGTGHTIICNSHFITNTVKLRSSFLSSASILAYFRGLGNAPTPVCVLNPYMICSS